MALQRLLLLFVGLAAFNGCDSSNSRERDALQERVTALTAQNNRLKVELAKKDAEIKALKESPGQLLAGARAAQSAGDLAKATKLADQLLAQYPDAPEAKAAAAIKSELALLIAESEKKAHDVEEARKAEEAARKAAAEEAVARATRSMRESRDEVQGITWYTPGSAPSTNAATALYAYIGKKDSRIWLRYKVQYAGPSWLFVNQYTFNIDGEVVTISNAHSEQKRDHAADLIWEWTDLVVDPAVFATLNRVANSQKTILRYEGDKYRHDREVYDDEKIALKNVFLAYAALGGKPPAP